MISEFSAPLHLGFTPQVSLLKEQPKTGQAETGHSQRSRHVASGSPPGSEPGKSGELHDVSFLK